MLQLPVHLDDVVSAEVINTEKQTNGHTDKNDRKYSNKNGKSDSEKKINPSDSTNNNRTTDRQHNKDLTDVMPSFVGDVVEESKLEQDELNSSTALKERVVNGTTGKFGNGEQNHVLLNGVISDSEMDILDAEVQLNRSQIEEEFDSVTKTIAELATASLLQSDTVLNDKSETISADSYSDDLKQLSERSTKESESKDFVMDTTVSSTVMKTSNEIMPEPNLSADYIVEHSESQISNMYNASSKQENK